MKKSVLICLLALVYLNVFGQANLDSLWNNWNDRTKADTSRLKAIDLIIGKVYMFSQPDSAYYFAERQWELAKSSNNQIWIAKSLYSQAVACYLNSDPVNALRLYDQSIDAFAEIDDVDGIGKSQNGIGTIYYDRGEYKEALNHYWIALKNFEEADNKSGIAKVYNNIGGIYQEQGDHAKAIEYYSQSLKLKEEVGDNVGIAKSLTNIGVMYYFQMDTSMALVNFRKGLKIFQELGDRRGVASCIDKIGILYYEQGDFDRALTNYSESLNIYREVGDKRGESNVLSSIGNVHNDLNELELAMDYYTKALALREEMEDRQGIATSLINMTSVRQKMGLHKEAVGLCDKAYSIASVGGFANQTKEAAFHLYESYKALGMYSQALEKFERYTAVRDSIMSEDNQRDLTRIEFANEIERTKQENAILLLETKQKNWALWGGGVFLAVVVIGLGLGYRNQQKLRFSESNELRSQIELFKMKWNKEKQKNNETVRLDLDINRLNEILADPLTNLESEVVRVWFDDIGLTRDEVAAKLFIGLDGLKRRISLIFKKLDVNSKEQAMKKIMQLLNSDKVN